MMKEDRSMHSVLRVITCILVFAARSVSYGETPPAASLPARQETCPYIVQEGDTLSKIAWRLTGKARHYTDIMRSNHLTSEAIYPGDLVHIPRHMLLSPDQCALDSPQARSESPATSTNASQESDATVRAEIESLVFEDRNDNGRYDAEEPGVPGIGIVLVRTGKVLTSDGQGRVLFSEVEPGEQAVGLEEATVPAGFRLCTASTVLLTLTEGDRGYVAFGMRLSKSPEPPD